MSIPERCAVRESYSIFRVVLHDGARTPDPTINRRSSLFPLSVEGLPTPALQLFDIRVHAAIHRWPDVFLENLLLSISLFETG